jgi:hypothetical protein
MTTAQTGIWGFGPQREKELAPDRWYRHKALAIRGGVIDQAQPGPPEVGSLPVPTAPHKSGYSVAGVIDFQPRLVSTFGFLLHALMGDYASSEAFNEAYILASETLTGAPQAAFSVDNALPVATGRKASVTLTAVGNTTFTGTITVNGTDLSDVAQTENHVFTAATKWARIEGTQVWKTIASIDLPAYENVGDAVSVGYESGVEHTFKFASDPAAVKWIGLRKYIPQHDGSAASDLLESYTDCKILNFNLALQNAGLLAAQMAFAGRDFVFSDTSPSDWENAYETFESMPVSVKTGAFARILGPNITGDLDEDLKMIGATIGMDNIPIPVGVDRIYASPKLDTLDIAARALRMSFTAKWRNPDLYRACVTNSVTGTVWSETPLTAEMDIQAESINNMTNELHPWGLRFNAGKALFRLTNAVPLVGNQVVLVTYDAIALENPGSEYATIVLRNLEAEDYYDWPPPYA